MKKLVCLMLAAVMLLSMTACGQNEASAEKKKLVLAGYADMNEIIKPMLEEKGYEVEIMAFSGLQEDAMALKDGQVDCVIKNNNGWVKNFSKENDTDIITMEPYMFSPVRAVYSLKHDSLDALPQDGIFVIAADAANQERDLLTMQDCGLIKLGEEKTVGTFYSVHDIVENPKNLEIMTVDHTTAPNYLQDVDAVICGAQFMQKAELDHNAYLAVDPNLLKYCHGLMIHETDKDAQWVKDIIEVWNTQETADAFNEIYQGTFRMVLNGEIMEYK